MAITLKIHNSYSQITGLQASEFRRLKKLLSYLPTGASYTGFARPKYLIDAKGNFPTGLFPRVIAFLGEQGLKAAILDVRVKPLHIKGLFDFKSNRLPYLDQMAAANSVQYIPRAGICMPTGTGKTFTMALIIQNLQLRTLIVVPNVGIRDQLRVQFKSWFGSLDNILIENIDSPNLKKAKGFDCLIVDEAHHSAASTYQKLNKTMWGDIYRRIFFTATYFRNQKDENLLFEGIAGKLTYQLTYKDAIARSYIVPVEAYYVEVPRIPTTANSWAQVYSKLVVNNQVRNEMIAVTLLRLQAENIPTLVLVKEIEHGAILSELTGVPFMNGQDSTTREYLEQFNSGEITTLIGTTGVLGEGIDTVRAEWVIIAGLGKAKSQFMQAVGRTVRRSEGKESAKVLIFDDKSHKFPHRHFLAQKKILQEEYNILPILLKL